MLCLYSVYHNKPVLDDFGHESPRKCAETTRRRKMRPPGVRPAKTENRPACGCQTVFFSIWNLVLLTRQQHGQHGFLDVEAVFRLVKDLVRVLLEQGGGDLLAPVGGQAVQHQCIRLCVFQ